MNVSELRGKTPDELKSLLLDKKREQFNLRFQKVSGELEKTTRIREVRRTIARINTLLNDENASKVPAAKPVKAAKAPKVKAEKAAKEETSKKEGAAKAAPKKKASKKDAA